MFDESPAQRSTPGRPQVTVIVPAIEPGWMLHT
jgi:hypothetical protein